MNIGENIKKYRKEKNLTQEQLAYLLGLSKNAIYNYENNKRVPNVDIVEKLSKVLEISLEDLFNNDSNLNANNNFNHSENNIFDEDIHIIQRAKSKMPKKEQDKMMSILKTAFEDYFNDED